MAKGFFSFIVAMTEKGVIGVENRLPWHVPEDLKRFKRLTTGHPIIMGRKTFESIGKPLPNRRNIVVTRQAGWSAPGVEVVSDLHELLKNPPTDGENFIIGGGEIFREAAPYARKIYVTWIDAEVPGDSFYPSTDWATFVAEERGRGTDPLPYRFVDYTRK